MGRQGGKTRNSALQRPALGSRVSKHIRQQSSVVSEQDPFRVFVTHTFSPHPDYFRVFEYLESAPNFFYVKCSDPE